MRHAQGRFNLRPHGERLFNLCGGHKSFLFPSARVVFDVGQHGANIHFAAIVVNRGEETSFVPADVEYRQSAHLIRVRKRRAEFRKVRKIGFLEKISLICGLFAVYSTLARFGCFNDTCYVNFRFDISKATDAACKFTEKEGGEINIMKLVKLVYLLDRLSVAK